MTGRTPRRIGASVTASLVSIALLAGCSAGEGDGAVGPDAVPTALAFVTADGVVAEPGAAAAEAARTGRGFVIAPEGIVLVPADVVVGAGSISVQVGQDEDAVPATFVGASECLDLAVLRIDGDDQRPFLTWRRGALSDGTELQAGIAPAAAGETPADPTGAVSAIEEPLVGPWVAALRGVLHDVPLPADASGAPLVDDEGRVAAIAHVEGAEADAGAAAVSAGSARDAVEQILDGDLGSLGISGRVWTDSEGAVTGVWVRAVTADGPAATAGVQPGDVITSLGGDEVGRDGTLATLCTALGQDDASALDIQVYRPATDEILAGSTGGTPLAAIAAGVVRRSGAFATVVDASGLVRVDVPVEWGQVDGSGFSDGRGAAWYSIVAAPNTDQFRDSRSAPGVQVSATGGGASAGDLLAAISTPYEESCEPLDTGQPFDDGVYAGGFSRFTCDGTVATVLSVRNARGNNVVVVAQLASVTDQQQTLSRILSTFAVGR